MSCLEKERKTMTPLKTLDIIFRRRYVPNTQHYFANRKHAVADKEAEKPSKPFNRPKSEKLLSYIKYSDRNEKLMGRDRSAKPLFLKDNLRIAATRDISKRLYIEDPPDDVRAVVEIHPEFYSVIEGRPMRSLDDIKVYVNNVRCYAMNRQQIGYRRDLTMKIETSISDESVEYYRITEKLKRHLRDFQAFLTEDYKKACAKVARAETVSRELMAKNSELLSYISQMTILNNILFKLDAIRGILKIYRSYLMFVAPISWRQKYDENLRGKIHSIQFESGEFVTDNDLVKTLEIDNMIEDAKIELREPLPANIYFKNAEQMVDIFRNMELQSRGYLIQLAKTDVPFRVLQDRIKQLKAMTKQELEYFQYYVDSIHEQISCENYNEAYLRDKFFRVLYETFFESVASPCTLKLKICIEYVYEKVIGKCDEGHQSIQDPMEILEVMYEDYNLRLDALDFKIVNQARSDFFAQDLKMMKNAYNAHRELKAFTEMTNSMDKAFLPPKQFTRLVVNTFLDDKGKSQYSKTERRKSMMESGKHQGPRKYKLSSEERDGLLMFTEWCEGMNPAPYLSEYYKYVKPAFEWIPPKSMAQ